VLADLLVHELRKRRRLTTAVGDGVAAAQRFHFAALSLEPVGGFRLPFTPGPECLTALLAVLVSVADRPSVAPLLERALLNARHLLLLLLEGLLADGILRLRTGA
jgi:hypothetical protein